MQLKFNKQKTIGETLISKLIKGVIICLFLTFIIFLVDKFNFPSPEKNIKKNITNEIIQLK
jgi:hypothetical protein|tara:strand:+ start:53 stop:235 length:183 start_codon:yes stop_codon:yes gene_type:complete